MATVIGDITDPDRLPGVPAISYQDNEIRVEWVIGTSRRALRITDPGPGGRGLVVAS
jgi:hypothetical protein